MYVTFDQAILFLEIALKKYLHMNTKAVCMDLLYKTVVGQTGHELLVLSRDCIKRDVRPHCGGLGATTGRQVSPSDTARRPKCADSTSPSILKHTPELHIYYTGTTYVCECTGMHVRRDTPN